MKDLGDVKRTIRDKGNKPRAKKKKNDYESNEESDSSGEEGGFFKPDQDESDDLDSSMIDDLEGFGESQPILPSQEEEKITENDDEAEKRERLRRRSSNLRRKSSGMSNRDLNSSIPAPHLDGDSLKKIYSSCTELFQNKQINTTNAFNLKLIDVLDQVIKKGDFTDMNSAGRLLEINLKIFSCRVMNTNNEVLRLASYIASNGKHKDGQANESQNTNGNDELNGDGEAEILTQIKEKKKRTKKIHKSEFKSNIETNLNKITMNMNMVGMSCNVGRRLDLKKDFTGLLKNCRNFNYIDYFENYDNQNTVHASERSFTEDDIEAPFVLPNNIINHEDLSHIPFLPFNRASFDPETDNVWGYPLSDADRSELNLTNIQESIIPIPDPSCVYNPEFMDAEGTRLDCDDMGGFDEMEIEGEREIDPPGDPDMLDITKVTSLDQIEEYFYRLSNKEQNVFGRGGWKGPNFTRRLAPSTVLKKKKKKEDEPNLIDFSSIVWKQYCFKAANEPVHFDEETMGMWQYRPKGNKFKDTVLEDEDEIEEEYLAPFRFLQDGNLNKKEYVDPLFRFTFDPEMDLFDVLKAKHGKLKKVEPSADGERHIVVEDENQPQQSEEDGFYPLEGFDIESIRVDDEDYCGSNGELRDSQGLSLPQATPAFPTFTDDMQFGTGTTDFDTVKHDKKPKIVDMHKLKVIIFNYLKEVLHLIEETGKANSEEDTRIPLNVLLFWILNNRTGKVEKNVTIHIAITAIMYLLAEKGLFLQVLNGEDTLIARGTKWVHYDHIPFAGDIREDF